MRALDGRRFSGGTSGLSIGHVSPEAEEGGLIGLVEDGDLIEIDIPNRTIHLAVSDEVLAKRRAAEEARGKDAWTPKARASGRFPRRSGPMRSSPPARPRGLCGWWSRGAGPEPDPDPAASFEILPVPAFAAACG